MTKVVIIGDMTLGETALPPGFGPSHPIAPPGRPTKPVEPTDPDEPPEVWPIPPGGGGLPPIAGQPLPPHDPPPGTIWPPLPPSIPPGKTLVYAGIVGVGKRWIVVDIPPARPGHGLPPNRPGRPEGPEVEPPDPNYPDQGLPHPEREPKRR
jgi:hypothetical protein